MTYYKEIKNPPKKRNSDILTDHYQYMCEKFKKRSKILTKICRTSIFLAAISYAGLIYKHTGNTEPAQQEKNIQTENMSAQPSEKHLDLVDRILIWTSLGGLTISSGMLKTACSTRMTAETYCNKIKPFEQD